jgi:predicted nucleic acid-binding protein
MAGDAALARPVLLDNTVLTNLALVRRSDLVTHLWPTAACTTPHALAEYQAGVAVGLLPSDAWADLAVVTLSAEETTFAAGLSSRLGAGERTCLAAATYRQGLLASDDLDVRHAARRHDVPTTGTVGILVASVRQGYLSRDQANGLLGEMIALGYRAPVTDVDELLPPEHE